MVEVKQSSDAGMQGCLTGGILFLLLVVGIQLPFSAPVRDLIIARPPIQAMVKFAGNLRLKQQSHVHVEVQNHSALGTKVVGVTRSCWCISPVDDLTGIAIPVGKLKLPLVVTAKETGAFHQRVTLFLDHPKQFRFNVDVVGFSEGNN